MVHLGKRAWLGVAAVVAALVVGTYVVLPPQPRLVAGPSWRPDAREVRGVYHIHTTRSDGSGTLDDVAAAAVRAGLQFVIVTDHGDATRCPDPPAYRRRVLCIDAVEISTTGGHYAALGLGQAPYPLAGEPRDVAEDVRRLGGFGIVAHPFSPKHGLAWLDWQVPFDGIEWLNGDSVWRGAPLSTLALAAWTFAFRPVASLVELYQRPATLDRVDELSGHRRVVLMAGSDAHARLGFRHGLWPFRNPVFVRVPSYDAAFQVASLRVRLAHALSGDATRDADAIIGAIRAGHLHTVVDGLARPASFEFTATSGGVSGMEGDDVPLGGAVAIRVRANTPPGGRIVLFREGREVDRVDAGSLLYAGNRPGAYRAEVWLPGPRAGTFLPWIVGNPVRVGVADQPLPGPEAAAVTESAFSLGTDGHFLGVEHDSGSSAELEQTGQAVAVRYALAGRPAPSPYAALVATTAIDPHATGLAFVGRADRPMRISVQLRAAIGGAVARWQRSVYVDQSAREVVVRFDDMRPAEPAASGRPAASRVRAVLFVVDTTNTRPGSSGRFALEQIRLLSPR
jgi:hypothetical protein